MCHVTACFDMLCYFMLCYGILFMLCDIMRYPGYATLFCFLYYKMLCCRVIKEKVGLIDLLHLVISETRSRGGKIIIIVIIIIISSNNNNNNNTNNNIKFSFIENRNIPSVTNADGIYRNRSNNTYSQ